MYGGMDLNEFNEKLVEFIEETTKKAVAEQTAKFIEETVKKAVGEYALKNELDHELIVKSLNTLMSFLIYKGVINRAELQATMDEALEKRVAEWNAEISGDKSKDKKIIFLNSSVVMKS